MSDPNSIHDPHPCPNCGKELYAGGVVKCNNCGKYFCGDYSCGPNGCPVCGGQSISVATWDIINHRWI